MNRRNELDVLLGIAERILMLAADADADSVTLEYHQNRVNAYEMENQKLRDTNEALNRNANAIVFHLIRNYVNGKHLMIARGALEYDDPVSNLLKVDVNVDGSTHLFALRVGIDKGEDLDFTGLTRDYFTDCEQNAGSSYGLELYDAWVASKQKKSVLPGVPLGIYFSYGLNDFINLDDGKSMGSDFWSHWGYRREEFPSNEADAIEKRDAFLKSVNNHKAPMGDNEVQENIRRKHAAADLEAQRKKVTAMGYDAIKSAIQAGTQHDEDGIRKVGVSPDVIAGLSGSMNEALPTTTAEAIAQRDSAFDNPHLDKFVPTAQEAAMDERAPVNELTDAEVEAKLQTGIVGSTEDPEGKLIDYTKADVGTI